MKWLWAVLFFIDTVLSIAQTPVIELKPIQKQGWKYYYDFKPVETPYALQIPLAALNDDEVNYYFNSYKTLNKVGYFAWIAPVLIVINGDVSPERFPLVIACAGVTNLIFSIVAHQKMKKAITRYNLLILEKNKNNSGAAFDFSIK